MAKLVPFLPRRPHVPVIRLQGVISASPSPSTLSDASLAPLIEKAFRKGRPAAVALAINSPGGSAVQSSLIAARIRRLAAEKGVKVYAFVEDVAASGGYWLATAADEIFVDDSSVLGSIGVISARFGFPEFISRHGVERRVHTAGASKSMLDPFRPERDDDVARLEGWLGQIHAAFIAQVKARRGTRLKAGDDLFTGDVWIGRRAVELGLADGIGHAVPKLKALFGDKVRLVPYRPRRPFFNRFGIRLVEDALGAVEQRAAYARFGL